jgi:hypothetical protein
MGLLPTRTLASSRQEHLDDHMAMKNVVLENGESIVVLLKAGVPADSDFTPATPVNGTVAVNTSTTPATIYVRSGGLWVQTGGGYTTVQEEGSPLTQRQTLDFVGPAVTVTDTGTKTQVSIPAEAPVGADYLVGTANAGLSAEIVVGTTPGGELGGTWAAPTVDALHSGSNHADFLTRTGGGKDTVSTIAASGTAQTLNLGNANIFDVTLTGNCTFTFSGATASAGCSFVLILHQDGTGGRTVTWPASVDWSAGTAPTLSSGNTDTDILSFMSIDGGTRWYGFLLGADMF